MAEIGSLFVNLGMQTAQFDRQLKEVDSQLRNFGKNIESSFLRIGKALGVVGAAWAAREAVQGIAQWSTGMAKAAETIDNLGASLGLTLKQVTEFQGVFQLTAGSVEEARGTMARLNTVVADAKAGNEDAIEDFRRIGISMEDLAKAGDDPIEILKLLADRWVRYADGADKSARFTAIFGRNVASIVPVLREGADGVERLKDEFNRLNPSAEEAAQKGLKLDSIYDRLGVRIKELNDRALVQMSAELENSGRNMDALAAAAAAAIDPINRFGISLQNALTENLLARLNSVLKLVGAKPFAPGLPADARLSDPADALNPSPPLPEKLPPDKGKGKGKGGGGGGGGGGAKDNAEAEAEAVLEAQRRLALGRLDQEQALREEQFNRNKAAIERQRELDELTADEAVTREQELTAAKWLADQTYYAAKLEAARGDNEQMISIEFAQQQAYERMLTRRAELTHDKTKAAFDRLKSGVRDFGSVLESSFSNIFDSVIEGTFKLKNAFSSLMRDMGKMLASRAFRMIMEGPSGGGGLGGIFTTALGGLFGAGSAAGASLSGVGAGIGAANGGSWRVAGAGGIDSQMVAFRATPGEMVDVTRQNHVRGGGEVINIALNPSEGWVAGVADQRIVTASGQIVNVAVLESQKRTARNFGSMSAQARDRQL